jgi:prolipoprotein diacylglyceryltransferase
MLRIIVDFGTLEVFGRAISLRVYGYGLMMVLGFLSAIALARWRARRAGENPDAISQMGILALVGGVLGARLAYVLQHWGDQFANAANPLAEALDITGGGLIYYGGLLLASALVLAFLFYKRLPVRRFLDIVAPALMLGLAFGRMGCLLNGCCFGALCDDHWALAARFPMYPPPLVKLDGRESPYSRGLEGPSPVYQHQLERGWIAPDDLLLHQPIQQYYNRIEHKGHALLPQGELHAELHADQLASWDETKPSVLTRFEAAAGADGYLDRTEWDQALSAGQGLLHGSEHWTEATEFEAVADQRLDFEEFWSYVQWRRNWLLSQFDSDGDDSLTGDERDLANQRLQVDEISLARSARALAVKPAQVLGIVNALLLASVLAGFHRVRRREGQVFALLMILYPITRFVLEGVRDDNPHDLLRGVLTHNQYTSLAMVLAGVLLLAALTRVAASNGPVWAERLAAKAGRKPEIHGPQNSKKGLK